jgi:hypothetical protein
MLGKLNKKRKKNESFRFYHLKTLQSEKATI